MPDVYCVFCGGRGETYQHHSYANRPGVWGWFRCSRCDGTGTLSQTIVDAYHEGRRRRNLRVAAHISQREMAQRWGVTPQQYSQMEQGLAAFPVGSDVLFEQLSISLTKNLLSSPT